MSLYKLQPRFVERPWGVSDLAPLYPDHTVSLPVGEVWLTSEECVLESLSPAVAAPTLGDLWRGMNTEQRGNRASDAERFPLLVKFLFTADKLSVQLHPDDDFARREGGEPWGKSEAWHILAAKPGAWVKVGFLEAATAEDIDRAWGGSGIEDWLNTLEPAPGDTINIPAGTVHSVGPGLCMCEVQQYSDLTYRIYDYDRPGLDGKPRSLHLDLARRAVRIPSAEGAGIVAPRHGDGSSEWRTLVMTPQFRMERLRTNEALRAEAVPECITIHVVIEGRGMLATGEGEWPYSAGEAFLQSAGKGEAIWKPGTPTSCLRIRPAGSA